MGMTVKTDKKHREKLSSLCERASITFEWRDDGRDGLLTVDGGDEECRFVLRRMETAGMHCEVLSLDGKELRGRGEEEKDQSVFGE